LKDILVVDDLRKMYFNPDVFGDHGVEYARTNQEAIDILREDTEWDEIWLDHDLGPGSVIKRTVDYITNNQHKLKIGKIYCHSSNPVGRRNTWMDLWTRTGFDVAEVNLHDPIVKESILVESIF